VAYVTGRGDQLPRFNRPDDTINGAVRPPATYLDAEEILRRQFIASVADVLARDPNAPHPRSTRDALGSTAPGTFLGELIALNARGLACEFRMPDTTPTTAEIVAVLDDDDATLTADRKDAWRDLLRWSNLLNFRMLPAAITTRRHAAKLQPASTVPPVVGSPSTELSSP